MKKTKKFLLTVLICLTAIFGAIGFSSCDMLLPILPESSESSSNLGNSSSSGTGNSSPSNSSSTTNPPKDDVEGSIGLEFTLNDDGKSYSVTRGTCTDTEIIIPSTYKDLPVTAIGYKAFLNCDSLTSVKISDSVQSIGERAFYDCRSLTSVKISDSVQSIGYGAFEYCTSLTSVKIPDSVQSIGNYAFYECDSLTSITVDENNGYYKSIDRNLYTKDGKTLIQYAIGKTDTSFTIPDSVQSIENRAFYDCTSLTSVKIGDGVQFIGNYTFYNCSNLTSINIPNNVISIGEAAFAYCASLTSITIPDSVTSLESDFQVYWLNDDIRGGIFYGCNSLQSITLPFVGESKTASGYKAVFGYIFGYNKAWDNDDGDDNTTYQYSAYTGTGNSHYRYYHYYIPSSLRSVTIMGEIISDYAFYNCSNLTDIKISNSVHSVGDYAFIGCDSLINMTISDNLQSIGFQSLECSPINLTCPAIVLSEIRTSKLQTLVVTSGDIKDNDICEGSSNLKSVTLNEGVTSIETGAFSWCNNLTNVVISDSVSVIGEGAFFGCGNLKYNEDNTGYYLGNKNNPFLYLLELKDVSKVIINENCKFIGPCLCRPFHSFIDVYIPESVISIAYAAFHYMLGSALLPIDSLMNIEVNENNNCYKSIDGNLYTKDGETLIQYSIGKTETSFIIPEGVINIYPYAFSNCTSLTSVTIPDSVQSIWDYAFEYCTSLTNIELPDSVQSISKDAFYGCTSLQYTIENNLKYLGNSNNPYLYLWEATSKSMTTATINKDCKIIGSSVFYNCTSLTSIEIPDSVQSIGNYAFKGCNNLTSIEIPNSVQSIGNDAFEYCTSLTSIEIPDSVQSIGSWAFSSCDSLTSVVIGDGVQSIGNDAFSSCDSLTSVVIGDSVQSIGNSAFSNCSSLTSVYITDIAAWCNIDFYDYDSNPLYYANNLYLNEELVTELVIPDDVTEIKDYAFENCSSLTSVVIGDSVQSIGDHAFDDCDSLQYNEYDNGYYLGNENNPYVVLIKAKNTRITSCKIHNDTKFIHSRAFSSCTSLTSVIIPDSVQSIGEDAFYYCSRLTSVEIPDSVQSIGYGAFYYCDSLTSVEIPDSVQSIGDKAFYHCDSLTSVVIGNGVQSIGRFAFNNCDKLTSISFKDTSTWYKTNNSTNWKNKENGTQTDVTKSADNVTYFKGACKYYYWYKL